MTLNYSIPAQNIVCFDLLNSSWDEINYNAIVYAFPDFAIEYIKVKYDELHSELRSPDSISKIYFEGSYIVSCVDLSRHNEIHGIVSCIDYELSEIKTISSNDLEYKKLVESIVCSFTNNGNLALNEIVNEELLNAKAEKSKESFYPFENEMFNLEVKKEMNINLEDFSKKFNINVVFEKHYLKLKTHRFKLASIYYRNQLPIAFCFQYYGKSYIAWNEEYLISILNIKPITCIRLSKTEQLNLILDRINEVGLKNLSKQEMIFLNSY
jgi:hypothetical protein